MPAPKFLAGSPCWIDLYSSDTPKATAFYASLFGWKAEEPQEGFGGYFTFTKDGKHIGGCMHNDGQQGMPDAWTVYLRTDDIEGVAQAVPGSGGRVDLAPMAVPPNGTMAIVADPGQASVGVWQPGTQQGFETVGETGTPRWFELHTSEYEATVAFYREVFGWDANVMSDTPDFRYTTLGEGDDSQAGIMDATAFLADGAAGAWSIYFGVDDTDAALEQVVELGGTVAQAADDTPWGRLAKVVDPTGAPFKLIANL
jgi:uncharacterized protein